MAKKKLKRNVNISEESQSFFAGKPDAEYIATMINPNDHRLYDIVSRDRAIYIVAPLPDSSYQDPNQRTYSFGRGGYDKSDVRTLEYEDEEKEYCRSHTPSGVANKGKGMGYILYSGLSLAVVAEVMNGGGVFSEIASRSESATRWWRTQVEREYAEESGTEGGYVSGAGIITVSIDKGMLDDDLDFEASKGTFGEELYDARNVEISEYDPDSVEVEVYVEGEVDKEVQFLPGIKVAEFGLVLAWDEEEEDLNEMMLEHGKLPPAAVLVDLDLSTTGDPYLVKNIWDIISATEAGISKPQLRKFLDKLPNALAEGLLLDHSLLEMYGQQRLPSLAEDAERAVLANPRPKQPNHSKAWKDFFGELVEP